MYIYVIKTRYTPNISRFKVFKETLKLYKVNINSCTSIIGRKLYGSQFYKSDKNVFTSFVEAKNEVIKRLNSKIAQYENDIEEAKNDIELIENLLERE